MSGTEWLIDVEGCPAEVLRELGRLQAFCNRVVAELNLHVIGKPLWHQFPPPGGITGMYLLSESHLTCHTFPETGRATLNLYCCRPRPEWDWEAALFAELAASRVQVRQVAREGMVEPAGLTTAAAGDDR
jgi:S-adenosylmethionine decarboxylase